MQRFFVEPYQVQEEEHRITLTGPDVNHMKNVLRMRIGEDVWISDGGQKEYHCTIEAFEEEGAVLHILYAQEPQYELPSRIYLFQGLPKGDKMELIIQKAVELGAYSVVPVETKRCVVKLDEKKAAKKTARWQQIAESGFEEEEVQAAMEAGAKPVTLGKRILRTETAGMTMLSILMFTLEKEDE